ncbi:hypothetical protein C8R42DRAFT_227341 [Lentinula raphanica]|nr:hypothetical protein C8R42DRAFT_227341 [Lentinula raphanica]
MLNGQENYPDDHQWSVNIEIYIAEPESGARERHLTREKTVLGVNQSLERFPMMFKLDNYNFFKKLQRYSSFWKFREANVVCTIDWKHTEARKPDISGIKKVLEVTELMLLVCDHLDLRSVEALRQTCSHFRNMQPLADIGRTRMYKALARIFTNRIQQSQQTSETVKSFNALLHAGGGIVGGSTALHVFCPGDWLPADLDIVVRESHQAIMEKFLTEEGFVLNEERTREPESFYPGGEDTGDQLKFTYRRFERPTPGRPGIDLCVIHPRQINAPAEIVLTYHSTVVMNFWTGRAIYSLWPDLTINGKLLRNKFTPTPKVEEALAKYARRGFFDIHDPSPEFAPYRVTVMPPLNIRFLQDDYPDLQETRLTVKALPGPTWRKEYALA